jgi:hypothetical protein
MGQDSSHRIDNALTGRANDLLRSLVATGLTGPAGDVVEGVLAGVESVRGRHHIGDRLGFDLPKTATEEAAHINRVGEQDVSELVSQGLDRLGIIDIVADPNHSGTEVGDPVRSVAIATLKPEALLVNEPGEGLPQVGRCFADEQHRTRRLGWWRAIGLGDVEDRNGLHSDDLGPLALFAIVVVLKTSGSVG